MAEIKNIIGSVLEGWRKENSALGGDGPEELLKKILTKREVKHIKLNYFKKGILSVNVDSSSWSYSLNLKKQSLLDELKKSSSGIKDLKFRIGEIK